MGIYQNVNQNAAGDSLILLYDSAGNGITSHTVSSSQGLDVYIVGGSLGTADEATFTYGTTQFQPVGGVYQDTSPTLTAGQTGAVRLTQYRGQHINLRTSGGVELLGQQTMAASIPVVISSNQASFPVSLTSLGSVSGGTAGTQSDLAGLIYNSSPLALTNGQQASLQGDSVGNLLTNDKNSAALNTKASPATGTVTPVSVSTSSTPVLASNTSRKGFVIHNNTLKVVNIAYGFTPSGTSFTTILQPNGVISEMQLGCFTGAINAIWPTTTTGLLLATELT